MGWRWCYDSVLEDYRLESQWKIKGRRQHENSKIISIFFRWNSKVTASWVDISNKSYLGLLTLSRLLRATQTNLSPISIDTLLEWIRIFFWKKKSRSLGSRTIGHMRFAKFWSKKIDYNQNFVLLMVGWVWRRRLVRFSLTNYHNSVSHLWVHSSYHISQCSFNKILQC